MKSYQFFAVLLILLILVGCSKKDSSNQVTPYETNTTAYHFTLKDKNGQTIDYFICKTIYSCESTHHTSELNKDALLSVFNIHQSSLIRSFEVSGHPAAIYENGTSHYICCTISPESSVVLQYSPAEMEDETAICIIQSIFESQAFQA